MDALCAAQEDVLARLERTGVQGELGPKLNAPEDPQVWFNRPGAPKPKLANEDPQPETIDYDTLIRSWQGQAPAGSAR
jgi:glycerol transport system substrate-binding protein